MQARAPEGLRDERLLLLGGWVARCQQVLVELGEREHVGALLQLEQMAEDDAAHLRPWGVP